MTTKKHIFLLMAVAALLIIFQGCTTTYNNNQNWHRTPPSTGRSRCGCMLPVKPPAVCYSHVSRSKA